MNNLTDIRPGTRRFLPKSGKAYVMTLLDQNCMQEITGLFNMLAPREKADLSHKKRADFERHFAAGHLVVGAVAEEGLIAQSLLVLPTAAYPETGLHGMPLPAPPQNIAVLSNMMVHPLYRGNGLQGEMILDCLGLAAEKGRTHLISDVYTDNQASWKTFLNKGFSIRAMDANPAISPKAVYFLHAEVGMLEKGGLTRAFNDAIGVAFSDLGRQKHLLAEGYRGVGYDSSRDILSFSKAP